MFVITRKEVYQFLILSIACSFIFQFFAPVLLPKLQGYGNKWLGSYGQLRNVSCNEFFHGKAWPKMIDYDEKVSVKLCQTVPEGDEVYFASMYNVKTKIPIYSANVVTLSLDSPHFPRPKGGWIWDRVALSLCNLSQVPKDSIASNIGSSTLLKSCEQYQAENVDYTNNGMSLDRGHLSPNAMNSDSKEKQLATFTLTNAAPQYSNFNQKSWADYEKVAQQSIIDFAPNEKVYVVTGTFGAAKDKNGNDLWIHAEDETPVLVPGYYWKAVCYSGSVTLGKPAWGYALIQENVNVEQKADYNQYMKIREFSDKYFKDDIFGPECMSAGFGVFASIFSRWEDYIKRWNQ